MAKDAKVNVPSTDEKEMSKEEQLKAVKDKIKLASVELGENYTATVEKGNYKITFKIPTIEEEYKIIHKMYEFKKDLGLEETPMNFVDEYPIRVLSTLDYVITEMKEKVASKENEFEWVPLKKSFWEFIKAKVANSKLYSDFVYPIYEDYSNFRKYTELTVDELKN